MKKMIIFCLLISLLFILFLMRPIEILPGLYLTKRFDGVYDLVFRSSKIGDITGLDSWYVQKSQVYGSLSAHENENQETEYFYVDICSREIYITPYYLDFEKFLDERNISQDKRNYMSGNNIINMQKFPYSKDLLCK